MTDIRVYPDKTALMQAAAAYVTECYERAVADHGRFSIALSGGSTPRALYEILAQGDFNWVNVHIFWGDERTVAPDHPESNYRMVREALLNHVRLPSGNVYRIRTEFEPERAAADYEQSLRQFFGAAPRFDLILLGMGDDGHTASLFPGTAALNETEKWVMANPVPQLNTTRITLTAPVINAAANVVFLISSAAKAERLQQVIEGPRQPELLPSQLIAPQNGSLVWLVDADAAAGLAHDR